MFSNKLTYIKSCICLSVCLLVCAPNLQSVTTYEKYASFIPANQFMHQQGLQQGFPQSGPVSPGFPQGGFGLQGFQRSGPGLQGFAQIGPVSPSVPQSGPVSPSFSQGGPVSPSFPQSGPVSPSFQPSPATPGFQQNGPVAPGFSQNGSISGGSIGFGRPRSPMQSTYGSAGVCPINQPQPRPQAPARISTPRPVYPGFPIFSQQYSSPPGFQSPPQSPIVISDDGSHSTSTGATPQPQHDNTQHAVPWRAAMEASMSVGDSSSSSNFLPDLIDLDQFDVVQPQKRLDEFKRYELHHAVYTRVVNISIT